MFRLLFPLLVVLITSTCAPVAGTETRLIEIDAADPDEDWRRAVQRNDLPEISARLERTNNVDLPTERGKTALMAEFAFQAMTRHSDLLVSSGTCKPLPAPAIHICHSVR